MPFELIEQGRASAPLYCYRPLTGRFIADRSPELAKLPSYLAGRPGPDGAARPARLPEGRADGARPSPDRRIQADAALQAFLTAVWAESSDFDFDRERFDAAFGELEEAAYGDRTLSVVLAAVEGLVIESDEVALGDGLALVRAETLKKAPEELLDDEMGTVAVLALDSARRRRPRARGRRPPPAPAADRAAPVGRRRALARPDRLGAHRRRRLERGPARHRHPPRRRRLPARPPTRRTRCARSARSSPAARRAAASSPGRCGASSSAASARAPSRR